MDISSLLEIESIELWSNIIKNKEITEFKDGIVYFDIKLQNEWELRIKYKKFYLNNIEFDCSFTLDKIPLCNKDWRKIKTQRLNNELYPDSEVSFYLYEHEIVDSFEGEITYLKDDIFKISLNYNLVIKNFISEPIKIKQTLESQVKYNGIIVQIYDLEPKPISSDYIKNYIRDAVNINSYKQPEMENAYRCILRPKVNKFFFG
jgi:hypothetical protein